MTGSVGAETVVEVWLDLPIPNSGHESENKYLQSENESSSNSPKDILLKKHARNIIEQGPNPPPIKIKMEEPLTIIDTPQVESQEAVTQNYESPSKMTVSNNEFHQNKSNTPKKSSEGCLNEIRDIFKDAASTPVKQEKVDEVHKVEKVVKVEKVEKIDKVGEVDKVEKIEKVDKVEKVDTVKSKITPIPQKKALVRCLDTNGKIIFVELQIDPKNPKNIKIIKTPTQPAPQSIPKPTVTQTKINPLIEQIRTTPLSTTLLSNNPSNSANQLMETNSTNSTSITVNPKPITVQGNTNVSQLNLTGTKNVIENKKVFIIKPPTPSNPVNPPPLVRISNPTKVTLVPNITNQKVLQPLPKPTPTRKLSISSNNVIMKNGQIIILSKDKLHTKPKQESLLKPQISLLKPLYQKQTNESTTMKSNSSQKPSCQIFGSRLNKQIPLNQNVVKRDYQKDMSILFLRHRFDTVRSAVEYLLRNAPLINTLSSRIEFSAAFPFVAESQEKFDSFPIPKRRSYEVRMYMLCCSN